MASLVTAHEPAICTCTLHAICESIGIPLPSHLDLMISRAGVFHLLQVDCSDPANKAEQRASIQDITALVSSVSPPQSIFPLSSLPHLEQNDLIWTTIEPFITLPTRLFHERATTTRPWRIQSTPAKMSKPFNHELPQMSETPLRGSQHAKFRIIASPRVQQQTTPRSPMMKSEPNSL